MSTESTIKAITLILSFLFRQVQSKPMFPGEQHYFYTLGAFMYAEFSPFELNPGAFSGDRWEESRHTQVRVTLTGPRSSEQSGIGPIPIKFDHSLIAVRKRFDHESTHAVLGCEGHLSLDMSW